MSNIPKQKHSDEELSKLRARSAMQSSNSPIAAIYNKKLAHRGLVILGYALPLIAPILVTVKLMSKDSKYLMSDLYIMVIPIFLALLIALWIALKRVLSRHNAAFIFIISLFCCFPVVNAVNKDKDLRYKLLLLIRVEQSVPQPDPLLEQESETKDLDSDSVRELLRKEEERILRENRGRTLDSKDATDTLGQ
jgi:hypothetical protein